jgi:hypothetical protein
MLIELLSGQGCGIRRAFCAFLLVYHSSVHPPAPEKLAVFVSRSMLVLETIIAYAVHILCWLRVVSVRQMRPLRTPYHVSRILLIP